MTRWTRIAVVTLAFLAIAAASIPSVTFGDSCCCASKGTFCVMKRSASSSCSISRADSCSLASKQDATPASRQDIVVIRGTLVPSLEFHEPRTAPAARTSRNDDAIRDAFAQPLTPPPERA